MEPHATIAGWEGGTLTLHDSNQGVAPVRDTLARLFGIAPEQVRVISPHVGGGFGSKGTPRPNVVLAALAAKVVGRPVKLSTTRHQQFALAGYRTPTLQRVRLGADADGHLDGDRPRGVLAELDAQGVHRADDDADARDVRGREPPHDAPAHPPRRAHPLVDACAR